MLAVNISYTLVLSPEEFRIISDALRSGGKNKPMKEEFQKKALELQDRLFKARNQNVRLQLERIQKMEHSEV